MMTNIDFDCNGPFKKNFLHWGQYCSFLTFYCGGHFLRIWEGTIIEAVSGWLLSHCIDFLIEVVRLNIEKNIVLLRESNWSQFKLKKKFLSIFLKIFLLEILVSNFGHHRKIGFLLKFVLPSIIKLKSHSVELFKIVSSKFFRI